MLAGLEPKPLVVHTVNRETGEDGWRVTKASGVYDRDGNVKLVVNVIEDITEVKRAELTQRMLARAGELLSSSLDYEAHAAAGRRARRPAARRLVHGVACPTATASSAPSPSRTPTRRRSRSRGASASATRTPADAPTGAAQVIRDGVSQVVDEVTDEMLAAAAQDDEHLELLRSVGMRAGAHRADDRRRHAPSAR